ncbi:MAG TPA: hypothetical protein VJ418_38285 [Streptosporangiaceae bacterium]|jgi:hypothetical protein|nr:hypothetical protein [Streptosporangiaceae bacterium]
MVLSGALFALFMTGFWLYCLTDAILTPAADCRGLRKQGWVALIAVTFIAGASAWLIVRRPVRDPARVPALRWDPDGSEDAGDAGSLTWTAADDAVARHPAGRGKVADPRAVPKGPDDDREFLAVLERAIRRNPPVS